MVNIIRSLNEINVNKIEISLPRVVGRPSSESPRGPFIKQSIRVDLPTVVSPSMTILASKSFRDETMK